MTPKEYFDIYGVIYGISSKNNDENSWKFAKFYDYDSALEWLDTEEYDFRERVLFPHEEEEEMEYYNEVAQEEYDYDTLLDYLEDIDEEAFYVLKDKKYTVYTGTVDKNGLVFEDIVLKTNDLEEAINKGKEESYYLGLEKHPERQICEVREYANFYSYNVVWNWRN